MTWKELGTKQAALWIEFKTNRGIKPSVPWAHGFVYGFVICLRLGNQLDANKASMKRQKFGDRFL